MHKFYMWYDKWLHGQHREPTSKACPQRYNLEIKSGVGHNETEVKEKQETEIQGAVVGLDHKKVERENQTNGVVTKNEN